MKNIEILKNYIENNNGIVLASDLKKLCKKRKKCK